jgi:hypothetical protein
MQDIAQRSRQLGLQAFGQGTVKHHPKKGEVQIGLEIFRSIGHFLASIIAVGLVNTDRMTGFPHDRPT